MDYKHRAIFPLRRGFLRRASRYGGQVGGHVVAKDGGILAGFVIVDRSTGSGRQGDRKDAAMPELDWLIVSPAYQGNGVAGRLMEQALAWVGDGLPVQLGVIHFNARAIAFYKKWGFEDTGRNHGEHKIRRRMMVRPA